MENRHSNGGQEFICSTDSHSTCGIDECRVDKKPTKVHPDKRGPQELNCIKHMHCMPLGCEVSFCDQQMMQITTLADEHDSPGRRCKLHFIRRCDVEGCGRRRYATRKTPDQHGSPGNRCKRHWERHLCSKRGCMRLRIVGNHCRAHSHRRCSVIGCNNTFHKPVRVHDQWGDPGDRCVKHSVYDKLCNVEGCTRYKKRTVKISDCHGEAGQRCNLHLTGGCSEEGCRRQAVVEGKCRNHSNRRCAVVGCHNYFYKIINERDQHGEAGYRCVKHCGHKSYYHQCNAKGCVKRSNKIIKESDEHGEAGYRCWQHANRLCNVEGCKTSYCTKVRERDVHGEPGDRCRRHSRSGTLKCQVEECGKTTNLTIKTKDSFGAPGRRCAMHLNLHMQTKEEKNE